jgi:hypothetical protein
VARNAGKGVKTAATIIILAVFGIIIGVIVGGGGSSDSRDPTPKTAEEIRRDMIEGQFSAWDGSHRKLVQYVKNGMNDPGSYEHVETQFRDDGDSVFLIMTFRGNNAFGAKVANTVYATANPTTGEILSAELAD